LVAHEPPIRSTLTINNDVSMAFSADQLPTARPAGTRGAAFVWARRNAALCALWAKLLSFRFGNLPVRRLLVFPFTV
jgi:hypothetical protein